MDNTKIFDQLKQPLDPERVKKRQGGGSSSLSYIEAHDAITHLNKIFGFDGWEFALCDFEQIQTPKGFLFRQTVRLSVYFENRKVTREDVGVGIASNSNADQVEKGMKEAASDGLKRAARFLGDQFANSLYDKLAPEHHGEARAKLATAAQLKHYHEVRDAAEELGFKTPKGNAPVKLSDDTSEEECIKRTKALEKWIEEKEAQEQMPETLPASTEPAATSQQAEVSDVAA